MRMANVRNLKNHLLSSKPSLANKQTLGRQDLKTNKRSFSKGLFRSLTKTYQNIILKICSADAIAIKIFLRRDTNYFAMKQSTLTGLFKSHVLALD